MGQDYYDDRDQYHTGDAAASPSRRDRHMRKHAKENDGERRDAAANGTGKSRGSHNWPPRSKYRIRPWS